MQTSEIMHTLVELLTVTVKMINEQLIFTDPISFDADERIKLWLISAAVFHSHIYINLSLIRRTSCWYAQTLHHWLDWNRHANLRKLSWIKEPSTLWINSPSFLWLKGEPDCMCDLICLKLASECNLQNIKKKPRSLRATLVCPTAVSSDSHTVSWDVDVVL